MKKGDVGIAKCFSEKYRNKDWAINYVQSESYVKMPVNAWCYIPTSLPQEQATKTNMASVVRIQVLSIMHMTDHASLIEAGKMSCIVRIWHIPNKSHFPSLATGLLVSMPDVNLR